MRYLITAAVAALAIGLPATGSAAPNPNGTGQPSQTCLSSSAPSEPGNASNARGSAFNENGGIAGGMYAGSQPQNSRNSHSVAQYDVACYQVSH